jgi:hypothetical protein
LVYLAAPVKDPRGAAAPGGSYAKLFDGAEKPLSWDNILWIHRTVLAP